MSLNITTYRQPELQPYPDCTRQHRIPCLSAASYKCGPGSVVCQGETKLTEFYLWKDPAERASVDGAYYYSGQTIIGCIRQTCSIMYRVKWGFSALG